MLLMILAEIFLMTPRAAILLARIWCVTPLPSKKFDFCPRGFKYGMLSGSLGAVAQRVSSRDCSAGL
jgi:hypothetical protein